MKKPKPKIERIKLTPEKREYLQKLLHERDELIAKRNRKKEAYV